jgi:hypothetical protein
MSPVRIAEQKSLSAGALGITIDENTAIVCLDGILWLTAPSTGDIVLARGERAQIRGRGRLAIQALEPASFVHEHGARRGLRALRRWFSDAFGRRG